MANEGLAGCGQQQLTFDLEKLEARRHAAAQPPQPPAQRLGPAHAVQAHHGRPGEHGPVGCCGVRRQMHGAGRHVGLGLPQQAIGRLLQQADGGQLIGQRERVVTQTPIQEAAHPVAGQTRVLVGRIFHPLDAALLRPLGQLLARQSQEGAQHAHPDGCVGHGRGFAHAGQAQQAAAPTAAQLDGLQLVVGVMGGQHHPGADLGCHVGQGAVAPSAGPGFQTQGAETGGHTKPARQERQPERGGFGGTEGQPVIGAGLQAMVDVGHGSPHHGAQGCHGVHQHLRVTPARTGQQQCVVGPQACTLQALAQGIHGRVVGHRRRWIRRIMPGRGAAGHGRQSARWRVRP